jgi:glucose-6-phosphate 1-dehydrogenase
MESFALVIFGVTGNLAQIKLIPALYDFAEAGMLPETMHIIGIGRKSYTQDEFKAYVMDVLHMPNRHHQHEIKPDVADKLLSLFEYQSGDMTDPKLYSSINSNLGSHSACENRIYYLATYPNLYEKIFTNLQKSGLNKQECGWVRVIIEKPIGQDEKSAKTLNTLLSKYYVEDQIYRLDHYLGRETLQNLLTFRFGNGVFEPIITAQYIDHIQVTAAEDFGISLRGGYYDSVGALKDVGQNHLLQMIALSTMNAPKAFTNPDVTSSRIDLLKHLVPEPDKVVFGQYEGYQNEKDVKPNSQMDTFFAFRTHIDSPRFLGVPIYVRAGKMLKSTVTEVAIVFKNTAKRLFENYAGGCDPNILVYRIQPNDGIVLRFVTKTPGTEVKLENAYMQFCYHHMGINLPDPYLRLLVDALHGDQTFFNDAPEIEAQWHFIDPLVASRNTPIMYKPGSWGPKEADALLQADGRSWIEPSVAFCSL